MKSNSINFVFHGNGLEDVFVDNIPMTDRLAGETTMIGNTSNQGTVAQIKSRVDEVTGKNSDDNSIMLVSGDAGVKIFTKEYLDERNELVGISTTEIPQHFGDTSRIEINGKPLSQILAECTNSGLEDYHTTVTNAAATALDSITNANDIGTIKTTLKTFFETIK